MLHRPKGGENFYIFHLKYNRLWEKQIGFYLNANLYLLHCRVKWAHACGFWTFLRHKQGLNHVWHFTKWSLNFFNVSMEFIFCNLCIDLLSTHLSVLGLLRGAQRNDRNVSKIKLIIFILFYFIWAFLSCFFILCDFILLLNHCSLSSYFDLFTLYFTLSYLILYYIKICYIIFYVIFVSIFCLIWCIIIFLLWFYYLFY